MKNFSNGITFGLMFSFIIDKPRIWQAVLWGTILELAMLFTPYPQFFGIKLSLLFVIGSFIGHIAYGLTLGWYLKKFWKLPLLKSKRNW